MDFISLIFYFIVVIPSAIIHEYAHGWMAWMLGDSTAKYAGRLTLDPRAHIDKWGTIILPLFLYFASGGSFMFAYAKPVPYNPYNLKNQRWGPALVGLAGPMANLLMAAIFSVFIRLFGAATFSIAEFLVIVVYINILLAVFNLVPIPPLDGSKILFAVLPYRWISVQNFLEQYGFFLFLIFIFFLSQGVLPIVLFLFRLIAGSFPFF